MIIEGQFSYFLLKPYVVTPHLKHLVETVQMRGHNREVQTQIRQRGAEFIKNYPDFIKIILIYHQILPHT